MGQNITTEVKKMVVKVHEFVDNKLTVECILYVYMYIQYISYLYLLLDFMESVVLPSGYGLVKR